jgi:V8-like Glu-specific endopeptidase
LFSFFYQSFGLSNENTTDILLTGQEFNVTYPSSTWETWETITCSSPSISTMEDKKGNVSLSKTKDALKLFTDLDYPDELINEYLERSCSYPKIEVSLGNIGPTLDFIDDFGIRQFVSGLSLTQKSVGLVYGENINNATGFLISPSLFITNYHVIQNPDQLKNGNVSFNYQKDDGIPQKIDTYAINDTFYIANDDKDEYDYAIIKLIGDPGESWKWGHIDLKRSNDKLHPDMNMIIIQHPGGGYKQFGLFQNHLIDITPNKLIHYKTDTLKGSSGSPIFDTNWNLVGLHHAHTKPPIKINGIIVDTNEGILISKIKEDLISKLKDDNEGKKILTELGLNELS